MHFIVSCKFFVKKNENERLLSENFTHVYEITYRSTPCFHFVSICLSKKENIKMKVCTTSFYLTE